VRKSVYGFTAAPWFSNSAGLFRQHYLEREVFACEAVETSIEMGVDEMKGLSESKQSYCFRLNTVTTIYAVWIALLFAFPVSSHGADLEEIQKRGVMIHLGLPYANFVTGSGDGLDVELMEAFAQYLGVRYQYVSSSWQDVIPDLIGKRFSFEAENVRVVGEVPVKGDIIANGMTILPQRERMVSFGTPTFPTQVWLIARHDSSLKPITPSQDTKSDISTVKSLLQGREVLGITNTCLDPELYQLTETGARIRLFPGNLNELAPAIINGEAELTLLDVPDSLIALEKWPGKLKVIGPISPMQTMSCAFPKESEKLRQRFNLFFEQIKIDGSYLRLVRKYYPTAPNYFSEFFRGFQSSP
jgi:ABC-type amino acid transport substrate-binding protein